jgi:superfamily I DNA/RNA helicase
LGWRLCTEVLAGADVLKNSIKKSADFRKSFKDCLPREMITKIKKLRAITVKLQAGQLIGDEDRELFFENLGVEPNELGEAAAKELIFGSSASGNLHCTTNIKITTILGSKGLSYDYVFMINFDDQYLLPRDGEIDDESINKFFVALTRSRKKIFIYTTKSVEPTFVSWISQERKTVS